MSTLNVLLQWCKDNGIWIDPRLHLQHDDDMGTGVYSKDLDIPHLASLVHIPKDCVLSARSCSPSNHPSPLYGHEAQYALSLALYVELLKGKSSRWFGYLQSLPNDTVDLPVFWAYNASHSHDGQEGMMWLRGTEVERHFQQTSENSLETITDYYYNIAEPVLKQFLLNERGMSGLQPKIQEFYRAYSLVSSRAFFVDAYHGLAMVPVADAFNHTQENHVHLQSEFSVCPQCGSLHECAHDRDGASVQSLDDELTQKETKVVFHGEDLDDFYEMVSNAAIPPHSQVFNTYGESLTNAQLLSQYGFILDANENDYLSWDPDEVYRCISLGNDVKFHSGQTRLISIWKEILLDTMGNGLLERISDSQLVYLDSENSTDLCLNGDGKISYPLWVFLVLPSIDRGKSNLTFLSEALSYLLDYQLMLETVAETDGNAVRKSALAENPLASTVAALAHRAIALCVARKTNLGKVGADHVDLGGIIDMLPADVPRTRQAISIVMSERSILDSCEYRWRDIFNITSIDYDGGVHRCVSSPTMSETPRSG